MLRGEWEVYETGEPTQSLDKKCHQNVVTDRRCVSCECTESGNAVAKGLVHRLLDVNQLAKSMSKRLSWAKERYEVHLALIPVDLPCTIPREGYKLHVKPGSPRNYRRQYDLSATKQEALNSQVHKWIDFGVVTRCNEGSPYNSPIMIVPKRVDQGTRTGTLYPLTIE